MRIELFGSLQITSGQEVVAQVNTNRLRSLLAYLVLHAEAPQSREHLAFLLWPESSESQARTNLRQLLHHLRRALPAECGAIAADNQTVQLQCSAACSIDVREFDAAVEQAAAARKRGDGGAERQALETAADLYQDDLVRGLYDEWLQGRRDHYRQQLEQVLERLTLLLEEKRDFAAAIRHAERLVAHDPIREAHHQQLIRLHAANRDRAGALRSYHQCMRVLRRELGVEPCRETREIFEAVLKAAPVDSASAERPPKTTLPASGPLVGRQKEWDRLLECWRLAGGRTQLAVLSGEPGIGKSRLAEELYDWCSRRQEEVARAKCHMAQGQLAYAPIAEWLRAKPLRDVCGQMPQSQLAELARVLPEILAENSLIQRPGPLSEKWERHHFYESLNAAFGKARKPLLLLIDDLQWCDHDSLEWLHSLFRSEPVRGILVVATVRPEETGRSHPFVRLLNALRQAGQAVEFPLQPLTAQETVELATQDSGRPLAAGDAAELYRTTKGNPLFVLESLRAGLTNTPADGAAPPRIYAVIAGRLAQLSSRAYELAGVASIPGHAFTFDLLAKATDWDEESVAVALDELWQRRIVEGHNSGQDAGAYDFTHDRLREVAYAEMSPVRRRFLHRRVARAMEELHTTRITDISGELATHYEAAGMAEPAIRFYREAADVACQRYGDAEAAGLLRRALSLCRDLPESTVRDQQELELLVALGPALITTQGYAMPEVGETYGRALLLSRELGEIRHLLSAVSGSWVFHVVRGQLATARDLAQQFIDLAGHDSRAVLAVAEQFSMGSSLFHLGRFGPAEKNIRAAMESYGDRHQAALTFFAGPDIGVFCRCYLSHILWHLGYADQAAAAGEQAIAAAQKLAHPFSLVLALNYDAMLYAFRRESTATLARAEESAAICRKYNFAYYLPMAGILSGWARAVGGEPEGGLAQLREELDGLRATGAELRLPFYHGLLAEACLAAGREGEGLANIAIGLAFQSKNGEVWAGADLYRIQGDILRRSGDIGEAQVSYHRAIEAAREAEARPLELRAAACLCSLPEVQEPWVQLLHRVYDWFGEGYDTPDLRAARRLLENTRAAGC